MKPDSSEIITFPKTTDTGIGTQLGGHGLATLLAGEKPAHATPELARDILRSSPVFSGRRAADLAEVRTVEDGIDYLLRPAPRKWVAGRAATLLSHYFQANTDEALMAGVAEDWCAMLDEYPAWAIANATRWWMSRENPRKHIKPLPGDIQDRAYAELTLVRCAKITLRSGYGSQEVQKIRDDGIKPVVSEEEREKRRAVAEELLGKFANRASKSEA